MKTIFKIFITLVVVALNSVFFISIFNVQAQTKVASPSQSVATPTKSEEDRDIESLKEKIATKVAELRQKNNKAVSGEVTEKSDSKLNITTSNEEEYQVIIDSDLTKFYQLNGKTQKEVKSIEVKKGSYIIATGVINDSSIDANFVYIDIPYIVDSGKVTEVNKEDFFIRLISNNKENYILDVERTTKQEIVNIKTLVFEKVGFSKIKEGDTIHFVVKKVSNPKEVNRYSAERVLIIPQEYFIK